MNTNRFTDADVIASVVGDPMAEQKPLCSVCLREKDAEDLLHANGERVCPTCRQTERGQQALESYEQKYRRLFGAGTKKGRR